MTSFDLINEDEMSEIVSKITNDNYVSFIKKYKNVEMYIANCTTGCVVYISDVGKIKGYKSEKFNIGDDFANSIRTGIDDFLRSRDLLTMLPENVSADDRGRIDNYIEKIQKECNNIGDSFWYIGFLLWEMREYKYYYGDNFYDFAEKVTGYKRTSVKNLIAVNERFAERNTQFGGGGIMLFRDNKYKGFSYSQLCEMLPLSDAQLKIITPEMTINQIRNIKQQQLSGGQTSDQQDECKVIDIELEQQEVSTTSSSYMTANKLVSMNFDERKKWIINHIHFLITHPTFLRYIEDLRINDTSESNTASIITGQVSLFEQN